jgi:unsaturated chondroitin disaccharide hydrolase
MLASLVPNGNMAQRFHDHAQRTIGRLCEREFVAHEDEWDGVLKHDIYHQARQLGIDESVMWGDYYYFFVETLARVLRPA